MQAQAHEFDQRADALFAQVENRTDARNAKPLQEVFANSDCLLEAGTWRA
jgi:hypothetical protein